MDLPIVTNKKNGEKTGKQCEPLIKREGQKS